MDKTYFDLQSIVEVIDNDENSTMYGSIYDPRTYPKVLKELNSDLNKIFPELPFTLDIDIDYNRKSKKGEKITFDMFKKISIKGGSCYYNFYMLNDKNNTVEDKPYKLSMEVYLHLGFQEVNITSKGVQRNYFLRFPF